MNAAMLKMELYKIYSKKVIWVGMFLFLGLFALLKFQMKDKASVKYTLEPVREELSQAVSNEQFHEFVRDGNYNRTVDEMKPFIPASVVQYIERCRDTEPAYHALNTSLMYTINNYYERRDNRADFIGMLAEEVYGESLVGTSADGALSDRELSGGTPADGALSDRELSGGLLADGALTDGALGERTPAASGAPLARAKARLLEAYQNTPVAIELNLEGSANNFIDVNHSMLFPCLLMLLVLMGLAGIYSDEYTSGTQAALLTSKNGRNGVFFSKLLAAVIYIVSVVFIMEAFFMGMTAFCYHAPRGTISAASTYGMSLTTFGGSVAGFCVRQILGTLLACFTMGCMVMAVSVRSRNALVPFFAGGIYYGGTALCQRLFGIPRYLSAAWSLPGEMSPFMLQSQFELAATGHYTNVFGAVLPTLAVSVLFHVVLAAAALASCHKGYVRAKVQFL